jgi:hypothetical protein
MFNVPRLLARGLGRARRRRTDAPQAPEWLRRKVLADVRGERARTGARERKRRAAVHVGLGALLGGALVLVLVSVIGAAGEDPAPPAAQVHAARASLRRSGSRAELVVFDMPQPPIGEVYELWLVRPRGAPTATDELFTVTSSGSGSIEIPGGLRGVAGVIVTSEPLGGSAHPTSLPILNVPAPHL